MSYWILVLLLLVSGCGDSGEAVMKMADKGCGDSGEAVKEMADKGCGDSDQAVIKMADKAYANEDYVAALELYRKLAEKGDARSQNALGILYSMGRGTTKNKNEAVAWYIKAAEQGNESALNNLANSYKYGWDGVSPNYPEAIEWYKKCIAIANSLCFVEFGDMYERGLGLEVDYVEAARLYRMGADQVLTEPVRSNDARLIEISSAEVRLADMYIKGLGVQQDCQEADRLLSSAASRNTIFSQSAKEKLQEAHCTNW